MQLLTKHLLMFHNQLFKNKNTLLKFFLSKVFLLCFCLPSVLVQAQNMQLFSNSLHVNAGIQSISLLSYNNAYSTDKLNLRNSHIGVSYKNLVYNKLDISKKKFSSINLQPSVRVSEANFGLSNLNRTFINVRLGLNGMFGVSEKSIFLVSANTFANEDEFTIQDATLRFNGVAMYHRRVNKKFSYHGGIVYTFVFGSGIYLPIAGLKYQTGSKSIFNFSFPFGISWRQQSQLSNFVYGFSVRPNGGINQYQNKLSFGNENNTLVYRRSSLLFSGQLTYQKKNYKLVFEAGANVRQKFSFTPNDNSSNTNEISLSGTNNLVFNIGYIIFIKNKSKKALVSEKPSEELIDELADVF